MTITILTHLLERETADIFVPQYLRDFFEKIYHAHVLKEYSEDALHSPVAPGF